MRGMLCGCGGTVLQGHDERRGFWLACDGCECVGDGVTSGEAWRAFRRARAEVVAANRERGE